MTTGNQTAAAEPKATAVSFLFLPKRPGGFELRVVGEDGELKVAVD